MADDASLTSGSINVHRERSGSINSNGSGYARPASNSGSYEMPIVIPRPRSTNVIIDDVTYCIINNTDTTHRSMK